MYRYSSEYIEYPLLGQPIHGYGYILKLLSSNIHHARSFSITNQYIDDLRAFYNLYLTQDLKDFYPHLLDIKEATDSLYPYLFLSRRLNETTNSCKFYVVNYSYL